jgi:beta-catenin-like protein 1
MGLTSSKRYKKESPGTTEEEEFLENLFNCLCTTCVREENKNYLAKAEGLKLLQIMIK